MQFSFKSIFQSSYYLLRWLSYIACAWMIFLNVDEIIQKSLGYDTVFSKMHWGSSREAFIFCGLLAVLFFIILVLIRTNETGNRKGKTILCSLLALLLTALLFFIE